MNLIITYIVHEWMHYFEDTLSRSDSISGPHNKGDVLDTRIAFCEGLANAVSAIIGNNYYVDTMGNNQNNGFSIDMESEITYNDGPFNEITISKLIYDLFDNGSKNVSKIDDDNISLDLGLLYNVLTSDEYKNSDAFVNIYLFIKTLKSLCTEKSSKIDDICFNYKIPVLDEWGSTQYGDLTPIYNSIKINNNIDTNLKSNIERTNLQYSNKYFKIIGNGNIDGHKITVDNSNTEIMLFHKGKLLINGKNQINYLLEESKIYILVLVAHTLMNETYSVNLSVEDVIDDNNDNINIDYENSYKFIMNDSYGDGWNKDTSLNILINDTLYKNYQDLKLEEGYSKTIYININDGDNIKMEWNNEGTYLNEISWILKDNLMNTISSGNYGDTFNISNVKIKTKFLLLWIKSLYFGKL